jgi:hypothetical protein
MPGLPHREQRAHGSDDGSDYRHDRRAIHVNLVSPSLID